jgi:hypothetical protein
MGALPWQWFDIFETLSDKKPIPLETPPGENHQDHPADQHLDAHPGQVGTARSTSPPGPANRTNARTRIFPFISHETV